MLDMGWTEILVIGVVALIVVGPKDLPRMLRTLGQYAGKMRGLAREFQRTMNDAAREADLDELKGISSSLDDVRSIQSDAKRSITEGLNEANRQIDRDLSLKEKTASDAAASENAATTAEAPVETTAEAPAESPGESKAPNFVTSSGPVDEPDPAAGQVTPAKEKSAAGGG